MRKKKREGGKEGLLLCSWKMRLLLPLLLPFVLV